MHNLFLWQSDTQEQAQTVCPSGLRGWTQVPLSRDSWVQIPQLSFCRFVAGWSCDVAISGFHLIKTCSPKFCWMLSCLGHLDGLFLNYPHKFLFHISAISNMNYNVITWVESKQESMWYSIWWINRLQFDCKQIQTLRLRATRFWLALKFQS